MRGLVRKGRGKKGGVAHKANKGRKARVFFCDRAGLSVGCLLISGAALMGSGGRGGGCGTARKGEEKGQQWKPGDGRVFLTSLDGEWELYPPIRLTSIEGGDPLCSPPFPSPSLPSERGDCQQDAGFCLIFPLAHSPAMRHLADARRTYSFFASRPITVSHSHSHRPLVSS